MRYRFSIGAFAVAFALSTLPAAGQEKGGGGSSRPSGGSESGSAGSRSSGGGSSTGGTAVSRGGGGADSGGSTSRSSGGGMSDGSMGSSSSPSMPSSSGFGVAPMRSGGGDRAPQRASASSGQSRPSGSRSNGGESSGRSAVPRGGSSSEGGSSREGGSVRSSGSTSSTTSRELAGNSDRANDTGRRAVPAYSRPRDGRPTTGVAVDRGLAPVNPIVPPFNGDIYYIYRPYYYPYGFWGSAYGYGLGYLYYDPFWYGGSGYPGYGYGGSYSSGGYSQTYRDTGNLRLKIKPREAQVYVDGYFVGVVDSFDGSFQRLSLDGGGHKVEIKADGYETLLLDVLITPGETVTYKGDMKRVQ